MKKQMFVVLALIQISLSGFAQDNFLVTDLKRYNSADYIILTTDLFYPCAEDLARYRKISARDLVEDPKIVLLSSIKSQFSGNSVASKIKEFLHYTWTDWPNGKYSRAVLILGDVSENPMDSSFGWFFPTHLPYKYYGDSSEVSDAWFTEFDTQNTSWRFEFYPIGRIPARTLPELNIVISKIKKYEALRISGKKSMVLVVEGIRSWPAPFDTLFYSYFKTALPYAPGKINISPVYSVSPGQNSGLADRSADSIVKFINAGAGFLNYFGSSGYQFWATDSFFIVDSVIPRLFPGRLFVYNSSTIMNASFQKKERSIGEKLLFCEDKGCVAVWGDASEALSMTAGKEIFRLQLEVIKNDSDKISIGSVYRETKSSLAWGDVNDRIVLLGDPGLVIPNMCLQIDNPDTVNALPGTAIRFHGRTKKIKTGVVKVDVYGSAARMDVVLSKGIHLDHYNSRPLIDSFSATIISNSFTFNYLVPASVDISQPLKISFYAFDSLNEEIEARFINVNSTIVKKGVYTPSGPESLMSITQRRGMTILWFKAISGEKISFSIYSIQGRLITKQEDLKMQQYIFHNANIPTGFYIIRAKVGSRIDIQKTMIVK